MQSVRKYGEKKKHHQQEHPLNLQAGQVSHQYRRFHKNAFSNDWLCDKNTSFYTMLSQNLRFSCSHFEIEEKYDENFNFKKTAVAMRIQKNWEKISNLSLMRF